MSQARSGVKRHLVCWDCGAPNDPGALECWLCQRRNWRSERSAAPAKHGTFERGDLSQVVAWILIATAGLLLVWLAEVVSPAVLAPFLFLMVPAGLITWARGRATTGLQFAASILFLAVVLPVLLLTSLAAALWLVCLATGPPSFH